MTQDELRAKAAELAPAGCAVSVPVLQLFRERDTLVRIAAEYRRECGKLEERAEGVPQG